MQIKDQIKFFAFLLGIVVVFYLVDSYGIFSQENIVSWQNAIDSLGVLGPLGFIMLYVIGATLFLPGTIFTLIGGATFGVFWGSVLSVIGATIGAVTSLLLARKLGKTFIDKLIHDKLERVQRYNKKIEENGFLAVLILRLTPLIPYNGASFALAYSPVKIRDYMWGTAIGIIPGTVAYVYLGEAVASLSTRNIVIAVIGIIVYIALTSLLAKRIQGERNKSH